MPDPRDYIDARLTASRGTRQLAVRAMGTDLRAACRPLTGAHPYLTLGAATTGGFLASRVAQRSSPSEPARGRSIVRTLSRSLVRTARIWLVSQVLDKS